MEDGEIMFSIKKVYSFICDLLLEVIICYIKPALDQIITQIMENSHSTRPVPVTDAAMEKLDRQVLELSCKESGGY